MDPKERKQQAMQKLDQLYTKGADVPFTETVITKTETTTWKPGLGAIGSFITLGVGTFISLGYVLPEVNKALDSGFAGAQTETARTIMGLIPLMIVVTTMLIILGMVTGGSSHKEECCDSPDCPGEEVCNGSKGKKTKGA